MKQFLCTLLLLAIISPINAYDFQSGDLYYNITSNTTVEVASHYDHVDLVTAIIPKNVIYNNINYKVTNIGDQAFDNCSSLTSITIPNSVTSIGYAAFRNCYSLTSVTIPDSVTSIGSNAFRNCYSLTSVTIPNSVTSIGSSAFNGCDALTKTNYLGDIAAWCDIKFGGETANPISNSHNFYINDQEIRDLVIPNTVDSIHNYAFMDCSSLTSASIGNSVTSIGHNAFGGCSSLSSVTIGNSVTSIEDHAFRNCSSLTSINIPESVSSIGRYVFVNCSSLTSINIPESVINIGIGTFDKTGIYKDESNWENNELYIDNCLIALKCYIEGEYTIKDGVRLIAGGAFWSQNNMTKVNFPNSVKSISELAFSILNITYLEIPNNVKNIEESAFAGCQYLSTVTLGDGLTCIEDKVFKGCRALTSITIPNSITRVGVKSFENCSSLTSVTIGNGVTYIGNYAFARCDRLSDIYCYATLPPSSQESSFPHYYAYVYVPCESIQHYRADNVWGKFQNLQCLDTEETDIENVKGSSQTLNNCNKLLRDGQILILRDGKTYNVMGQEL